MTSSGPNTSNSISSDSAVGTMTWTLTSNARYIDDLYSSSANGTGSQTTSYYLKCLDFGFTIPADAVIDGVEARIWLKGANIGGSYPADFPKDSVVSLVVGGTVSGTNLADSTAWPIGRLTKTYGGSSNLWGNTLTPSDINSSNFGIVISATLEVPAMVTCVGQIDSVDLKIYYTADTTAAWLVA